MSFVHADFTTQYCTVIESEDVAPQTRQLFINHQAANRPNEAADTIRRESSDKTAAQRTEWVDTFNTATTITILATNRAVALAADVNTFTEMYEGLDDNTTRANYKAFFDDHERVDAIANIVKDCWSVMEAAWKQMVDVDTAQGAHQDSIQHNADQVQAALQNNRHVDAIIDTIGGMVAAPHVPADPKGYRKQPHAWAGWHRPWNRRKQLTHGDDVATGTVGLEGTAANEWRPWLALDGGMGSSTLWLRFDVENTLMDRVVRKTQVDKHGFNWRDPARFEGDIRDPQLRLPTELACHHTLNKRNAPAIVRLRGQNLDRNWVDEITQSYRVYTEWAMHGSLADLVKEYQRQEKAAAAGAPPIWIPEAFVWSVAESLCEAGIAMAVSTKVPGFEPGEMVHRDLKPANCFLGAPSTERYPRYAQTFLGDFGLAFKTFKGDANNPYWYQGSGTPSYKAPEQLMWVNQRTWDVIEDGVMGQHTNVFGVGLILWSLLTKKKPDEPWYLGDGSNETAFNYPANVVAHYSEALREMVTDCLAYDFDNRPSFNEVLAIVKENTGDDPADPADPDLSQGMRDAGAHPVTPAVEAQNRVHEVADRYRLGLAFNELPNPEGV